MERQSFLIVSKATLADKRISTTAKLVLAQLVDHRNKRTGQCNPREATLAEELGICKRTVKYRLAELRNAGLIEVKRTQRGNRYEFQGATFAPSKGQDLPVPRGNFCPSGAPYPLYEPYIKEPYGTRGARAGSSPNKKQPYNAPPPPRKSITAETLEAYYRIYGKKAQGCD